MEKQEGKLTEHFDLGEFTYSRIAVEHGIDNTPPCDVCGALRHLAVHLLEPLRGLYGRPIVILSGYRDEIVNRLAGGVATSQHRKGEAADCYVAEGPDKLLDVLKHSGLVFDQAILYKHKRFLHLSLRREGKNRMQVLIYLFCVVFMCCSCGTRKSSNRLTEDICMDSAQVEFRGRLSCLDYMARCDSISWELEQIVYLPPDSSGKQYVGQALKAKMVRVRHEADTSVSVSTSAFRESSISQEVRLERTEMRKVNSRIWPSMAGLACLLVIGLFFVKKIRAV